MIAFTADNHLGITSQWSIKERGQDFLSAFHDLCSKAVAPGSGIGSLVIGGDLFDTPYPPAFAVAFVKNEIRRLHAAGVETFGIDGNHDLADCKWLLVCGITPLSDVPVEVAAGVTACGISYRRSSDVVSEISGMADRGVKCSVLVLHLAFGELNRMGASSDISAADVLGPLKTMGVKLVLMGHIHIRQSVTIDGITFAYCGSTETCSMNEPREKSADLVDPSTLSVCGKLPLSVRAIVSSVVSTEDELARFESNLTEGAAELQSVFVTPDVRDGVKRLRALSKARHVLMRVQVMRPSSDASTEQPAIDRSTGVIGLEQAIAKCFKPDSPEAVLIQSILRAPEALKTIVDKFMSDGTEKGGC